MATEIRSEAKENGKENEAAKKERLFFDIFNKYEPTELEKNILNNARDVKIMADREKRIIEASLKFEHLVQKELLHRTEQKLCEAYNLASVDLKPIYEKELFCENYFREIIAEANKRSLNTCFLKDADITFENNNTKININLAHGGADYLENPAQFIKLLRDIIASEFGFTAEIELGGVLALYKNDERDKENTRMEIERIEAGAKQEYEAQKLAEEAFERERKAEELVMRRDKINAKANTLGTAEHLKIDRLDLEHLTPAFAKNKNIADEIMPEDILPINKITGEDFVITRGKIFGIEVRDIRRSNKKSLNIKLTDYNASIFAKIIDTGENISKILANIKSGDCVVIAGESVYSEFDDELVLNLEFIAKTREIINIDTAEKTRVELHLHTTMSAMDAIIKPGELVNYAYNIGQRAVAITDHGNVQGFPEAMLAKERLELKPGENFKVIYGLEGYLLDDEDSSAFGKVNANFNRDTFIIFDIETTGLYPASCGITEIGAVKVKGGEVLEEFNTYVDPERPIPAEITKLTGISDETVKGAPKIGEALRSFFDFAGDNMLVAHNAARFDMLFIKKYAADCRISFSNAYLDTLAMSRNINKDLKRHSLDTLVDFYKIKDFEHHRASDDSRALAQIFFIMTEQLKAFGIQTVFEMNESASGSGEKQTYHIILLVKNKTGLKNLYKIISASYLDYFYKRARIPKSVLEQHRDGLIIGSACEAGELFSAVTEGRKDSEIKKIAEFYDYFEVQPIGNNAFLINSGTAQDEEALRNYNRRVIELGEKFKKPVVATGDVHFLHRHDEIARQILLSGMKFEDADRHIPLYFRTTEEMLREFDYLPDEKAREIVIENTNKITDMIEDVRPIPTGSYTPEMEGAEERLRELCYASARAIYGEALHEIIERRLERELTPIINNGFAVLYMISADLIKKSEELGYLVGSRGSVGSSFVATMSGVSEVNPLPPHYYCKNKECGAFPEFITDGSYGSGYDLPEKICGCGHILAQEGQDIPFETFLGFDGEKSPDIDLNFSGVVQSQAHKYTEVLFGSENVFRAGTIGALADKTAFGFVMKYLEQKDISLNAAHRELLISKCVGVKRTTGQHPGGIIVVPREYDIYDFTPVQHPADDNKKGVVTTHFAFEYLQETILKLDLLGHDVPTKYKVLQDMTGIDVRDLPMNDKKVMQLFLSTESIGVDPREIYNELGTFGLPELGTKFVRQMIIETKPKSFADLLQISGLSHGTSVWLGNAQELIKNGTCTISEVIGTRDDIMLYLINKGLDSSTAFIITESVRKGTGLKPEWEQVMRENDVPEWYIDSCKKIKYMFPKAHASAYIIAAMRLGWFKVYEPLAFYASYFSVQPEGMDAELALSGRENIRRYVEETEKKGNEATKKEEDVMMAMLLVLEMYARGLKFLPIDIYKSEAFEYKIEDGQIRLPFSSLNGVGDIAAESIARVRDESVTESGSVFSVEDICKSAKLSKTVTDTLRKNGAFKGVPETNQISLF